MDRPRPWWFALPSMPYGAFNGVVAVALPYLLRERGFSVERIAATAALVQLPSIWYFCWAPVVDFAMRRRSWIVLLSAATGILSGVALIGSQRPNTMIACLVVASVLCQPISSAVGGLVAHVIPPADRGRTGGWSQAGMLTGGIIAGGATVLLADAHAPLREGLFATAMIALPALAAIAIREPRRSTLSLRVRLRTMVRETLALLRRRDTHLGLAFFLSPIGAGALMNLFSAVGSDFHASSAVVVTAVTIAGIALPVGALLAGYLCDRYERRHVYCAAGVLGAASVAVLLALPLDPATYVAGAAGYGFATGFGYGCFSALAFALLGSASEASSTQFTLFMAAVNIPVVYMLRLDGLAHAHFGTRGMLAVDGAMNLAFAIGLFVLS